MNHRAPPPSSAKQDLPVDHAPGALSNQPTTNEDE